MKNKDLARELVILASKLVEGGEHARGDVSQELITKITKKVQDCVEECIEMLTEEGGMDWEAAAEILSPIERGLSDAQKKL